MWGPMGAAGGSAHAGGAASEFSANRQASASVQMQPVLTTGIRLGTPAITTRGFGEADVLEVAALIHAAIVERESPEAVARTRERATALTTRFPLPRVLLSDLTPTPLPAH